MAPMHKKRKLDNARVEEITFDPSARQEYLTGFHKRKVQRSQNARDQAIKREKEEKIVERKQMREQRKEDLERQIKEYNFELRKQNPDLSDPESEGEDDKDGDAWEGIEDGAAEEGKADKFEPEEDEYVDEDKYTTVTVEAMGASEDDEEASVANGKKEPGQTTAPSTKDNSNRKKWPGHKPGDSGGVKKKKKKFRYESKAERSTARQKQKSKNQAAKAKRKGQ